MILGLLGGLLSGLGWRRKSLLSGMLGGEAGTGAQFLSTFGSMGGTLAQYGGQRRALANRRTFGSIRELYGRSNMAADAGTMVGGALDNYGRLLMRGARAGGVMPNYYAPLWERLSRGWEDYGADMHAMEFNALQRDYTYRAQRLANNMQLYNALLNSAFDIYEHGRGSVARTSHTRARTAEEGII